MRRNGLSTVFISHRSTDAAPAERLANELRTAGHDVWLDTWSITLGDSIVERISEGLEAASYVVVCYSSAGVMAPWMGREWMSSLARQLNGHGVKLLPVLLTGHDVPAILADLKYADLVTDWSQGITELLRAIK
jgi:TIR domain